MNDTQRPGGQLCMLLVCFAGAKTASHVRSDVGKAVRSGGGALLDEAVVKVSAKGKTLSYDPHRTIAGALAPALTWGLFGLAASGGSAASLVLWAVIGALCGGVYAHYTEHLASKSELKRIGERVGRDSSALVVFAEAADAERLLATTAPFKPAAASVAGITDDLSATVFTGATTPIESSSTATEKSSPANTAFLTMLLLRYSGEHAAKAALQATGKVNGGAPQVELVFEAAKNGRRRVISPTQGVAAFTKGAVVGWAVFGLAAGLIAGFAGDGGILSSIESGVVTGVIWGIFGLFAGSIYGEWEGRAVSARRLKGVERLLPPDSSMILAWAEGTVDPGAAGKLSTPAAQTLQVRFNPVDHGALLEV